MRRKTALIRKNTAFHLKPPHLCLMIGFIDDRFYLEMYDFEHSTDEDRYIAIGKVGKLLFVVFTERGEKIRLISARLANAMERRLYYDQDFFN